MKLRLGKKMLLSGILLLAVLFTSCATTADTLRSQDDIQVYYNGKVYTSDAENPSATAFVIQNGKFVYVGTDEGAKKYGAGTDLQGKRVIPGMIDSHCHPTDFAANASLRQIQLDEYLPQDKLLEQLQKAANDPAHKNLPEIHAFGFGPLCTPETATAKVLDKIISDRPAGIISADGHSAWLNTKAMQKANLTAATPDPIPGGSYYIRDQNGNPTGYIVEINAVYDTIKRMGSCTEAGMKEYLPEVQELFNRHGITAVTDAGALVQPEENMLRALTALEKDNKLTLRYYTSYVYAGSKAQSPQNMLAEMTKLRKNYTTELVHPETLKMFHDGTVEVFSAYMFEPYNVAGKGAGFTILEYDEMLAAAKTAAANGFNIHIHAIGDKAISESLDLYQALGDISGTKTMAHVQVMPADGIKRFIEQGDIFYQTTPVWLGASQFSLDVLGEERYNRQMPLGSMQRGSVTLTFGSDMPASGTEGINPFLNMYYAVNRSFDDGTSILPPPTEGITIADCIDAYTINSARQVGAEKTIGSITSGKSADFLVLSDDILTIPGEKIKDVTVEKTYFRGDCVYTK